MDKLFLEAKRIIDQAHNILLVSHTEPDGDSLGSMLALKTVFDELDKKADIFSYSGIPENYLFLPNIDKIKSCIVDDYDLIFGLDYGDLKRLETMAAGLSLAPPSITFDHHNFHNQTGEVMIIDEKFSSTCEIVFDFLSINDLKINREIALCLLTGIVTDTWNFRHPNTTAETLRIVGQLLLCGASLSKISRLVSQKNMGIKSRIWSRCLEKLESSDKGFVSCVLEYSDIIESQASSEDLSGLSSLLAAVPEAKFSLVLSEMEPRKINGSLRSRPDQGIDVSQIAKLFGGGGHRLAAAFKTEESPAKIIEKMEKIIKERHGQVAK